MMAMIGFLTLMMMMVDGDCNSDESEEDDDYVFDCDGYKCDGDADDNGGEKVGNYFFYAGDASMISITAWLKLMTIK